MVLRRVVPAEGRSRAYVNGRLATVDRAGRARPGRWSTCTASTPTRACCAGPTQRAALDRFAGVDLAPLARGPPAHPRRSRTRWPALGGDARARAREIDLLRVPGRRAAPRPPLDDAGRGRAARRRGGRAGRRPGPPRGRRAVRVAALGEDGARDALGRRRRPRWPAGRRSGAVHDRLRGAGRRARRRRRRAAPRADDALDEDPERLDEVARPPPAPARAAPQVRRDAGRGDRLPRGGRRTRLAELAAPRRAGRRRWRPSGPRPRRPRPPRRSAVGRAPAGGGAGAGRAPSRPTWASWPCPGPGSRSRSRTTRRATRWRSCSPPTRVSRRCRWPGWPPGGELARAMLALRLVLTEAPDTLLFDEVDAGVGGEAALAVGRALARPGAAPPGAGRHPPRPGGGVRRPPDRRRQAGPPTAARWPRPARSRARTGWSSWPGCCRG